MNELLLEEENRTREVKITHYIICEKDSFEIDKLQMDIKYMFNQMFLRTDIKVLRDENYSEWKKLNELPFIFTIAENISGRKV